MYIQYLNFIKIGYKKKKNYKTINIFVKMSSLCFEKIRIQEVSNLNNSKTCLFIYPIQYL